MYLSVDTKSIGDLNLEYFPFNETPGKELYFLCEDRNPEDAMMKKEEAKFWNLKLNEI